VDMGTIPENLFESELFGHRKGAFTDARADKRGKFELAHQGTLFLDEIGNLPLPMQSKLLNVLQKRSLTPVGGTREIPIDVRLISATNSRLDELIGEGRFRKDLLYRINTIHLEVPPLRERKGDIDALASFFLRRFAGRYRKEKLVLGSGVLDHLKKYHWPGNIRELEHTIERSVIMSSGGTLRTADILFSTSPPPSPVLPDTLEEMEIMMLRNALEKYGGNVSSAASQLGITRQTFYNKCRKYGL
jgi:two-component system response regulator HydG